MRSLHGQYIMSTPVGGSQGLEHLAPSILLQLQLVRLGGLRVRPVMCSCTRRFLATAAEQGGLSDPPLQALQRRADGPASLPNNSPCTPGFISASDKKLSTTTWLNQLARSLEFQSLALCLIECCDDRAQLMKARRATDWVPVCVLSSMHNA